MFNWISAASGFKICRAPKGARQSGLSLVEGLGMIVLVGIMASLAYPAVGGLLQAGQNQQAIGIAQALNQAQQTYQLRVANAVSSWSNATDSGSKYQLI